jgi:hypothetical protein
MRTKELTITLSDDIFKEVEKYKNQPKNKALKKLLQNWSSML